MTGIKKNKFECCSSSDSHQLEKRRLQTPWITGTIQTAIGSIPVVETRLSLADRLGAYRVRWGIGRGHYRIEPGLYAVGKPTDKSHVLVSANYKMSFDRLRSQLTGIDSWIMVLDTKGINVWCAAGKGTFGTDEVVNRIESVRLHEVVSHRKLILPQLGAPGVSAHEVKERSDFHVIYGPIRAHDIPAFFEAGNKATPGMRLVRFSFRDRIVLIPTDLVSAATFAIPVAACFILLSGLGAGFYSFDRVIMYGIPAATLLLITYIAGTALPPALLPWLPGKSFSAKGAWVGLSLVLTVGLYAVSNQDIFRSSLSAVSWLLIIPAVMSFIAMNFTGSSTFTSLSGVRKEMRIWMPIQISSSIIGLGLWIAGLFV